MATAYFFGVSAHADVLRTALRMPNVLQNLLGEGTISAAFIPIYSRMLEEGRAEDAGRFAGAILGLLIAVLSVVVLLGVLGAPYLVALLAPGFTADAGDALPPGVATLVGLLGDLGLDEAAAVNRYALTVQAVRLIFPMTGILVLFAWALGVLNSHRRFFLSYFAPVLWNVAILAALFGAAAVWVEAPLALSRLGPLPNDLLTRLLFAVFVGALVGSVLQFLVPLPLAFRLMRGFRLSASLDVPGVRSALRAFGPVVAGRGVYQISTYVDLFLASLLATGAVAALGFAQMLYILPVSLFGMSVAASELPELSRIQPDEAASFLQRIGRSLRQMLFMVMPTVVGYLALGVLIVGGLFERGSFGAGDTWLVTLVLGGYALGLAATTVSRLLQNAFYALGDTVTPAKIAVWRVVVSTVVAVPVMVVLDRVAVADVVGSTSGSPLYLGAVGLALGASVGAWVELWRLKRALQAALVAFRLPWRPALRMTALALGALVPAVGLWALLPAWPLLLLAALVVGVYGLTYLIAAHLLGLPEVHAWTGRLLGRFR
ncbi:MAG: murein biosynthesis integral membrane protein MurJ [Bacteroidetes bacterium]|nr:murein biosynthesis integral membrane protein MurJ [Bacteroidota bacterium]